MSTETEFSKWVQEFGVQTLVERMRGRGHSVTASAVYQWLRGEHEPRGPKVREMLALSGGRITADHVMQHFQARGPEARQ